MTTWPWEAEPRPKTLLGSQEHTPGHIYLPGHSGSCQENPDFLSPGLGMLRKMSLGLSPNPSHCNLEAAQPPPGDLPHALTPPTSGSPATVSAHLHLGSSQLFLIDHCWPGPWEHGVTGGQGPGFMAGTYFIPPSLGVIVSTLISQLEKLRHREVKELAYSLTAGKWQS